MNSPTTQFWKDETKKYAKITHSNDTYNRISYILERYARASGNKDFLILSEARIDMMNLVGNIEKAEYQKGLDAACEVIDTYNLGGQHNNILEEIKKL